MDAVMNAWIKLLAWFSQLFVYDEYHRIRRMYKRFGFIVNDRPVHLTKRLLRERLHQMREELDEFEEGIDCQDLEKQADSLIDLVMFAKATAVMMGLPWTELADDVMRANEAKNVGVGKRGFTQDLVKPDGWLPPCTGLILFHAGYDPSEFALYGDLLEDELVIDERSCIDYHAYKTGHDYKEAK